MTAVDRPDNGQDEGRDQRHPQVCPKCRQWCVYDGWDHVHPNGLGIGSCASGRAGAGEQQREQVARWLAETFDGADEWSVIRPMARWGTRWYDRGDELLALLGGPQPGGEA